MKTKFKTVGTFEAKTHLSDIISEVQNGIEYTVTNRGKPVAKIIPYSDKGDSPSINNIIKTFDHIRNSVKGNINIKEYINEGRK